MSVNIKGSAFFFGDAVSSDRASFSNFFNWIQSICPDKQWPYNDNTDEPEMKRTLFCNQDTTYFLGVFVSARNTVYQHFVKQENGKTIIEAISTGNNPPININFFCMRKDSNKGIFSHYVGSYPFNAFLKDFWATYRSFVTLKQAEHLKSLSKNETERKVQQSYSLYKKNNCAPLYTPGEFEDLIEQLETIEEVRATTYSIDSEDDMPVGRDIKSIHKVFRLDEAMADGTSKSWLKRLREKSARVLKSNRIVYSGSVVGNKPDGGFLNISFENTMEDYLGYDYDDLGTFSVDTLSNHELIRVMKEKLTESIVFDPARTQ